VEEERRLMYVGITRAMEKLYLTRAQFRRRFGKGDITVPSRFLSEIPEKLLQARDKTSLSWSFGKNKYEDDLGGGKPRFTDDGDDAFRKFERELETPFADEQEVKPLHPIATPDNSTRSWRTKPKPDPFASDDDFGAANDNEFQIGDRVKHTQFGEGIIENVSGSGASRKVKVHFRGVGPKLLLLELAKLKKV
jgi:DNA helicase II / ATP-dependent DNA helicase PcrA